MAGRGVNMNIEARLELNKIQRNGHTLFGSDDTGQLDVMSGRFITDGLRMCKLCGKAESELTTRECKPRTAIVRYQGSDGATRTGRLVRENTHTTIVKPYIWIHSDEIKIHKRKNKMQFTGRWI